MMTSTQSPEVDGKNSSTTKISLKEMYDLQQDRTAYDEYYRKVAYVPDDFPVHKLQEKNVKKWALCGVYSTDTIRQGYGKKNIQVLYKLHIQNQKVDNKHKYPITSWSL